MKQQLMNAIQQRDFETTVNILIGLLTTNKGQKTIKEVYFQLSKEDSNWLDEQSKRIDDMTKTIQRSINGC